MLIRDQQTFDDLVARLRTESSFAIDTEFISERSFRPRLCLVQIAYGESVESPEVVAVDPLAIDDLSALVEIVLDPAIEKILHSGQQDMMIFFDRAGTPPAGIYDTQIAAAFLGYGDSVGYTKLVEAALGVRLPKAQAFTDWSRRPLSEEQVEYALDDVRYLPRLRESLGEKLDDLGRSEWLDEEFKVYGDINFYRRNPETLYLRFRGARNLRGLEIAALQELALWREELAAERDQPRGRVISDEALFEIARRLPKNPKDLATMRALHPRWIKRHGDSVLRLLRDVRKRPPETYPAPPDPSPKDSTLTPIVDLLEVLLKSRAQSLGLSAGLIATRTQLYRLVQSARAGAPDSELPVLQGWRGRLIGQNLLELLEGRCAISVEPENLSVLVEARR